MDNIIKHTVQTELKNYLRMNPTSSKETTDAKKPEPTGKEKSSVKQERRLGGLLDRRIRHNNDNKMHP